MALSSIVSRIIPAAIGYATGGPVGAFTATVSTEQAKSQQKKIETQQAIELQKRKELSMQYPGGFDPVTGQLTGTSTTTQQAGMGGFFGGVGLSGIDLNFSFSDVSFFSLIKSTTLNES